MRSTTGGSGSDVEAATRRLRRAAARLLEVDAERQALIDEMRGLAAEIVPADGDGDTLPWPSGWAAALACEPSTEGLLQALPGVFFLFNSSGRHLLWNRNLELLTGYGPEELRALHPLELLAEDDRPVAADRLRAVFTNGAAAMEARLRTRDGQTRPMLFAGTLVTVCEESCVAGVGVDIGARKEEEERLWSLSMTDELTGLLNRRGFFEVGRERLARAVEEGLGACLLYADLDRLKAINDAEGHAAGDRALKALARALRETFRDTDVVARIGGDEFAVLATQADGRFEADALVERLREHLPAGGRSEDLSASIGHAACERCDGVTMDDLLSKADEKMYEDKIQKTGAAPGAHRAAARTSTPPDLRRVE